MGVGVGPKTYQPPPGVGGGQHPPDYSGLKPLSITSELSPMKGSGACHGFCNTEAQHTPQPKQTLLHYLRLWN